MLNEVLSVVVAVKQQEIKNLFTFYKKYLQILKYNVKQVPRGGKKYFFMISKILNTNFWKVHRFFLNIAKSFSILILCNFKGNPNFQGILDWILQILHYYCIKHHKNVKSSWIIEQNFVLSLPFCLFSVTCASCCLPQRQSFYISWIPYSMNLKHPGDHFCYI